MDGDHPGRIRRRDPRIYDSGHAADPSSIGRTRIGRGAAPTRRIGASHPDR